jgi:hypothetical protein
MRKTKLFRTLALALVILAPSVSGQRILHPVRVAVRAPANEVNAEMAAAVREELRRLGDVGITSLNYDYEIQLNAAPLVGSTCEGYVSAVVVVDRQSQQAALDAYSGATLREIARYIVKSIEREHFEKARAQAARRDR